MNIISCMSGTSLDGLDLAYCSFRTTEKEGGEEKIEYELKASATIPYTKAWKERLLAAHRWHIQDLSQLNYELGLYFSACILSFIHEYQLTKIDYIASHGHTILHQPENGFTLQIACGHTIAAQTKIPVVFDFRSLDVALKGQGAPLVPIGDRDLFSDYDYCINLGGFSNLSYQKDGQRRAYDIAPVNIALNHFATSLGLEYDKDGEMGRKGTIDSDLLNRLNSLDYYQEKAPKSLGKEWLETVFLPCIPQSLANNDVLRTLYEHMAQQIAAQIEGDKKRVLLTGGGAWNSFLVERIQSYTRSEIVIPAAEIVDYKEALIFAYLAYLKINNRINVLSSVTGASRDSVSGGVVKL